MGLAIYRGEEGTDRHTPIITLTAQATGEDRECGMEVGLDGYLTRPIVLDDLREALETYTSPVASPTTDG